MHSALILPYEPINFVEKVECYQHGDSKSFVFETPSIAIEIFRKLDRVVFQNLSQKQCIKTKIYH